MHELKACRCQSIPIGRQGENEATRVHFDVSGWADTYGEGTFSLLVRQPKTGENEFYPVVIDLVGDEILWTVSSADLTVVGDGEAQLVYRVGDLIAKSAFFGTFVGRGADPEADPPESWEAWVMRVLAAEERVTNAVIHSPMIGDDDFWYAWDFDNDEYYNTGVFARGGVDRHDQLPGRDLPNQHPMSAITGLTEAIGEMSGTIAGKQDTIADLPEIRSGAALGATALQSVPATYRTAAAQDAIDANKQDVITDLPEIRSGAALGATALQSVPTTYRTAAAQDAIDASKQDVIADLASIRTGAGKGATALQPGDLASWALQPQKPAYTKSEVGLGNVANERQYSALNPPPYPVTSVNGQTGAVVIPAAPIDATLTHADEAADAKAVGDRLTAIETGEHFAEVIDDSAAYIKAVPPKSLRTALLNSFGAASMRWNQYSPNDAVSEAAGGLTFTKNADLSVTVTGTASANTSHYISDGNSAAIPAGHTVFLFGCPAGGGSSRYRLRTRINGDWGSAAQTDYGSGVIFITQEESTFRLGIYVNSGVVVNDIVFRPCLVDLTAIGLGDITDPSDPALDPVRSYAQTHLAPSSGAAVYFAPAMVVSRDSGGNTVAVYPTEGIVDEFFPLGMMASGAVYDEVDLAGAQVIQRIGSDGEPLDSPTITPMTEPILRDIEVAAGGTLTFANDQFTAIAVPSSVTFVTYQLGGAANV